ncbi:hypothetical protein AB0M28_06060 [Streptomyces sp. NPDC051940]|uniref:hypothetical protein n=1 Tax=Streptomyces sp. NPDC051940 TaxID=3155675 RepID=UPI00342DE01F
MFDIRIICDPPDAERITQTLTGAFTLGYVRQVVTREIGWIAHTATDKPFGESLPREFFLRKAAVLDRIAIADATDGYLSDAPDLAVQAARRLL